MNAHTLPLPALLSVSVLIGCGGDSGSSTATQTDGGSVSPNDAALDVGNAGEAGGPGDARSDGQPVNDDASEPDGGTPSSGPTIAGCPLFPSDYPYNQDISQTPLDPGSATYITNLKSRAPVIRRPGGGGEYNNVVPSSQPDVSVQFNSGGGSYGFDPTDTFYHSSQASGSAPIPANVLFEGTIGATGDHHMMVVQQGTCRLFELYSWDPTSATSGWSNLVTWNLAKNEQLPDGWGSTTAAGTPLLPGVIWYAEVMSGEIKHAVDIVIPGAAIAKYEYVKPAARAGGACGSAYPLNGFPYGGRVRLKAGYDTSAYTGTQALVVVRALQKYGMLNTDDSGETRSSFRLGDGGKLDQTDIMQLSMLSWDDFEVPAMTVVTSKACN
jgi:hypothetical protein